MPPMARVKEQISTMRPGRWEADVLSHDVHDSQLPWPLAVPVVVQACFPSFYFLPTLSSCTHQHCIHCCLRHRNIHRIHHPLYGKQTHNHLPAVFHNPPWCPNVTTSPQPFIPFYTWNVHVFFPTCLSQASTSPVQPPQGLHNKIKSVGLSSDCVAPGYLSSLV